MILMRNSKSIFKFRKKNNLFDYAQWNRSIGAETRENSSDKTRHDAATADRKIRII